MRVRATWLITASSPTFRKLCEFLDFVGMSATEVKVGAKQAKHEDDLDLWRKKLSRFNAKYVNELHQKERYVRDKLVVINSFFDSFGVDLSYSYPDVSEIDDKGNLIREKVFKPSLDTLRLFYLSTPEIQLRTFLMIAKDSGLSEVDIINYDIDFQYKDEDNNVTYDSVRRQIMNKVVPAFIVVPRQKTDEITKTFLGEESSALLYDLFTSKLSEWYASSHSFFPWDTTRNLRRRFREVALRIGVPKLVPKSLRAFFSSGIRSGEFPINRASGESHDRPSDSQERHREVLCRVHARGLVAPIQQSL